MNDKGITYINVSFLKKYNERGKVTQHIANEIIKSDSNFLFLFFAHKYSSTITHTPDIKVRNNNKRLRKIVKL